MTGAKLLVIATWLALLVVSEDGLAAQEARRQQSRRVTLDRVAIAVEGNQPSYVQHALKDLENYLKECTGKDVEVGLSSNRKARIVIAAGEDVARRLKQPLPSEKLGQEGFLLKSVAGDGQTFIVVAGATPMGTKHGLYDLMGRIQIENGSAYLNLPIDVIEKPAFPVRGMHFNGWMLKRPYSFRTWTESDWKKQIDILSYQRVNLLFLWPFMEIIPLPMSKEDESYLQEVRRVVDYAQREHGMEVWILHLANLAATNNLNVADPRFRPYWRRDVQAERNPGDPEQFKLIMQSHEALYRIVDNVDGVCTIDSDPGGYPGSTIDEFIQIMNGCRKLLDRYNIHGRKAKFINWMWSGWVREVKRESWPEVLAKTIQAMKKHVPEPWWLIAGRPQYLPVCKSEGVLGKTVFLPYQYIEYEPSYPGTNLGVGPMKRALDVLTDFRGVEGLMGNVQCPLLQFPRMFPFTEIAWGFDTWNRTEQEVLLEIGRRFYPEHKQLIADGYAALGSNEVAGIRRLSSKLDRLVRENRLGKPGLFGRKLFPDHRIIGRDLVMQLNLQAGLEDLYQNLKPTARPAQCETLVRTALAAYLTWDQAHGWHDLWGNVPRWQLGRFGSVEPRGDLRFKYAMAHLRQVLGSEASVESFFSRVAGKLTPEFGEKDTKALGTDVMKERVLASIATGSSLVRQAVVTASAKPDERRYPPGNAVDGDLDTKYWPGTLAPDNQEWLQLTWKQPQKVGQVIAYFLHPQSMPERTVRLQKETSGGHWEDIATSKPSPRDMFWVATFALPSNLELNKLRIVNMQDLADVEVQ